MCSHCGLVADKACLRLKRTAVVTPEEWFTNSIFLFALVFSFIIEQLFDDVQTRLAASNNMISRKVVPVLASARSKILRLVGVGAARGTVVNIATNRPMNTLDTCMGT